MYLGRNMGCKEIFLLFVLRWCWWCSTPICPQLKLRARILQVNCINVFFLNPLNLKTTLVCFQVKKVLIFFSCPYFSLQIYAVFNRWHFFFYWIHTYFMCSWGMSQELWAKPGLRAGVPRVPQDCRQDSNLWPALQNYSQANLLSQLFLLHAGIMSTVRKDSEGTTSSPHHSVLSLSQKRNFLTCNTGGNGWC